MNKFALGILAGTMVGAGVALALNPIDKKDMRRAYRRVEKMMRKMNCALHENLL